MNGVCMVEDIVCDEYNLLSRVDLSTQRNINVNNLNTQLRHNHEGEMNKINRKKQLGYRPRLPSYLVYLDIIH